MDKRNAFLIGVLGFVVAAVVAGALWLITSGIYRDGYDAGFRCAKYQICRAGEGARWRGEQD